LPRIRSGQVKALGVFYPERIEGMDNVQTADEAGFGDATLLGWVGLFAPARTPAAVLRVLTAAAQEGMTDPALVARLRSQGSKPFAGAPQVLMDTMRAESDRIKTIVAKKGIKVE
jgi:tripartite-type tricarboxylate transporter receptor subunit TctC